MEERNKIMVYKVKRFAKVWMKEGWRDIESLNDKQLHNVSGYIEDPKQQINASKLYRKLGRLSTIVGGALGYAKTGNSSGAIRGAMIGAGAGYGMGIVAHNHHRKNAIAAKKELNKRYPFSMHIDGKDEKGKFIRPQVGENKKGEPIWGDKIYL
jgi:hypothetical protein